MYEKMYLVNSVDYGRIKNGKQADQLNETNVQPGGNVNIIHKADFGVRSVKVACQDEGLQNPPLAEVLQNPPLAEDRKQPYLQGLQPVIHQRKRSLPNQELLQHSQREIDSGGAQNIKSGAEKDVGRWHPPISSSNSSHPHQTPIHLSVNNSPLISLLTRDFNQRSGTRTVNGDMGRREDVPGPGDVLGNQSGSEGDRRGEGSESAELLAEDESRSVLTSLAHIIESSFSNYVERAQAETRDAINLIEQSTNKLESLISALQSGSQNSFLLLRNAIESQRLVFEGMRSQEQSNSQTLQQLVVNTAQRRDACNDMQSHSWHARLNAIESILSDLPQGIVVEIQRRISGERQLWEEQAKKNAIELLEAQTRGWLQQLSVERQGSQQLTLQVNEQMRAILQTSSQLTRMHAEMQLRARMERMNYSLVRRQISRMDSRINQSRRQPAVEMEVMPALDQSEISNLPALSPPSSNLPALSPPSVPQPQASSELVVRPEHSLQGQEEADQLALPAPSLPLEQQERQAIGFREPLALPAPSPAPAMNSPFSTQIDYSRNVPLKQMSSMKKIMESNRARSASSAFRERSRSRNRAHENRRMQRGYSSPESSSSSSDEDDEVRIHPRHASIMNDIDISRPPSARSLRYFERLSRARGRGERSRSEDRETRRRERRGREDEDEKNTRRWKKDDSQSEV